MKFKFFCDLKAHFSIRIRDSGKGGIVWRWRDNFNFYFLEMFESGITIGKFVNGIRTNLYTHNQRYETDKWFRFVMVVD
jgi:hypothetical protein